MRRLAVIPGDPLYKYFEKGEIKSRYWNPCDFFDEVHIVSLTESDIDPEKVQDLVGSARLEIHCVGRPTIFSLPRYYGRVTRLIGRLRPHVIKAHGSWHGGSLGVWAGRRLDIPCLVSIHTDRDAMRRHDSRLILRAMRPLENHAMRKASLVICVSDYLHRYARAHGAKRTFTVYNRVYTSRFSDAAGGPDGRHEATVLSVMRLDPPKDPECLIRAVALCNLRLVLIGQGEFDGQLHNLVDELGITGRVEFVRQVPHAAIHKHYQQADIFAMSTHYEGFCIPVLEAMAASLPVVTCATDPIPEILGGTGLIVDNTPEAFSQIFRQLANDVELRKSLGAAGRARAVQLDGEHMEKREVRVFEALLNDDSDAIEQLIADGRFVN